MPWDHAPGWLLHQEAGGYSAHFDGRGYKPAHTGGGLICRLTEPVGSLFGMGCWGIKVQAFGV